ncbi:MAG TPA: hypothetical protein VG099_23735 [Gemmataceae bacterium]|jgi:hypothetical protein|nr:hypothetical protein [Gemmataceae bacterium]
MSKLPWKEWPVPSASRGAAVALAHGLTLVTHNAADYDNIPLLAKVDWLAP